MQYWLKRDLSAMRVARQFSNRIYKNISGQVTLMLLLVFVESFPLKSLPPTMRQAVILLLKRDKTPQLHFIPPHFTLEHRCQNSSWNSLRRLPPLIAPDHIWFMKDQNFFFNFYNFYSISFMVLLHPFL